MLERPQWDNEQLRFAPGTKTNSRCCLEGLGIVEEADCERMPLERRCAHPGVARSRFGTIDRAWLGCCNEDHMDYASSKDMMIETCTWGSGRCIYAHAIES